MNTTTHLVTEQLDVALSLIAAAGLAPEEVCGGVDPVCAACVPSAAVAAPRRGPAIGRAA